MTGTQFTVDAGVDDGIYLTVGETITVYERYEDAVAEIQDTLVTDSDSFLAAVTIDDSGSDDVAITLEQVGWQQVIRDMAVQDQEAQERDTQ